MALVSFEVLLAAWLPDLFCARAFQPTYMCDCESMDNANVYSPALSLWTILYPRAMHRPDITRPSARPNYLAPLPETM